MQNNYGKGRARSPAFFFGAKPPAQAFVIYTRRAKHAVHVNLSQAGAYT